MKIIKMLLKILFAVLAIGGVVLLIQRAAQLIADLMEDRTAIDLDDIDYYDEVPDDGTTI